MEAVRARAVVREGGRLSVAGLPFRKGQRVEMIVMAEEAKRPERPARTAKDMLESGLPGLWKARKDIQESAEYARDLRREAQTRRRG